MEKPLHVGKYDFVYQVNLFLKKQFTKSLNFMSSLIASVFLSADFKGALKIPKRIPTADTSTFL